MEAADLISNYQSKSDDELIQLAGDMEDLGPEARTVLAAELSKRGISTGEIDSYRAEGEEIQKKEKQQKLDSMFPSLRGTRARLADWRTFRQKTGRWPTASMGFYILHGLFAIAALMAAVVFGVEHGWSKLKFIALFAPLILIDVILGEWIERKIRLRELRARRESHRL